MPKKKVLKRVLIVDNGTQYMGHLRDKVKQYSAKKADVETVDVKDVKSKKDILLQLQDL